MLLLQLVMLAITASTTPAEMNVEGTPSRIIASADLDRAESGEDETEVSDVDETLAIEERMERKELGYEHVTVRIGVVDTITELWDSEARLVRRFR